MTHYAGFIAKVIFWVFCQKMAKNGSKWVKNDPKMGKFGVFRDLFPKKTGKFM